MSMMGRIVLEIQEMLDRGITPEVIAKELDIPLDWVLNMD